MCYAPFSFDKSETSVSFNRTLFPYRACIAHPFSTFFMLLSMEQVLDGQPRMWSYIAPTLLIEVVSNVQQTDTTLSHTIATFNYSSFSNSGKKHE